VEVDNVLLDQTLSGIPRETPFAARSRMPSLKTLLQAHPQALEQMQMALARARQ
jgi:hypothetical protein